MSSTTAIPARSHLCLAAHERFDAFWFALGFRHRVIQVADDAKCKSTIGRRIDTVLRRLVRVIGEAANGGPDKADERLGRAREAIGVALMLFNDFVLERGVRDVVIADLRDRAAMLLARLDMLKGTPVETWPETNCLPTALEEVKKENKEKNEKNEGDGGVPVDVIVVVAKVRVAAVRGLPQPVVAAGDKTQQAPTPDDTASGTGRTDPPPAPTT